MTFAIEVTLKLQPGTAQEFRPLILENARCSVRDEPDCLGFQVFQDQEDAETFVLVGTYTEPAALDRHRASPHYAAFSARAGELIASKSLRNLTPLAHGAETD